MDHQDQEGLLKLGFIGNGFLRKGGDLLLKVHQEHFADLAHLTLVTHDPPKGLNGLRNVEIKTEVPWVERSPGHGTSNAECYGISATTALIASSMRPPRARNAPTAAIVITPRTTPYSAIVCPSSRLNASKSLIT